MTGEPSRRPPIPHRPVDRAWARTPSFWSAPVALAVACGYVVILGDTDQSRVLALGRASLAHSVLFVIGAYVAVCAAVEMQTVRRFWGRWTVRRGVAVVVAHRLRRVLAGGAAVHALGYGFAMSLVPAGAGGSGSGWWPGWEFPTLSLLALLAWTAFGAAAGLVLGSLTAVVVAVLVPVLATLMPQAWSVVWVRHLTGALSSCCGVDQVLDLRAWVASLAVLTTLLVVSTGVVVVRLTPVSTRLRPTLMAAGAVVVVAGVAAGPIVAVSALGPTPTLPRPITELTCTDGICVWPERAGTREANAAAAPQVRAAWADLGLGSLPARFGPFPGPDMLGVTIDSTDPEEVLVLMAASIPAAVSTCATTGDDPEGWTRQSALSHLLIQQLGREPNPAQIGVLPTVPDPAQAPALLAALTCGR